jgi:xanthine dehydrogenase YagR molybdenum-binding subunit
MGTFTGRANDSAGLTTGGVGGVQIADVSVDTETGIVSINRYVAVHDCGMVVNPRLAESQVYGAVIMGIGTALFEERIMDQQTGHMLNANMEFYKLAGIGDIGDIVVHMDIRPENDKRGVIGLGEPPAIAICAAVGNAVANAIGIRVPNMPMTPDRVLNALEGRNV